MPPVTSCGYDGPLSVMRFDPNELAIHHAKHGTDFQAASAQDYEQQAERCGEGQSGGAPLTRNPKGGTRTFN